MKALREKFISKGIEYTQLHKDDKLVIYEAKADHYGVKDIYYEVFNYKVGSMNPMAENYDPNEEVELYPRDNAFGYWAWCCSDWKCIAKVLRNHYDYTDNDILNLASQNHNLKQLSDIINMSPN